MKVELVNYGHNLQPCNPDMKMSQDVQVSECKLQWGFINSDAASFHRIKWKAFRKLETLN